uniref:UDP-glucose:sterol glucosyltransferase, putative n=1 Tax=Arundo donax TaxID=35708 RepID=A0A0A9CW67_ARUDO
MDAGTHQLACLQILAVRKTKRAENSQAACLREARLPA